MTISISISGETPEDVQRALRSLAVAFGGGDALAGRLVGVDVNGAATTATITAKVGRGAPESPEPDTAPGAVAEPKPADAKAQAKSKKPDGETDPANIPDAATAASTEAPPVNVVKEMSAAEMREAGSNMLMQLFNRDPSKMDVLRRLQTKYQVKMFKDIPDDRAQEFYNDALLAANGTAEKDVA